MAFNEVQSSYLVPLKDINATVGTWALTLASNILSLDKSAADNTSVLHIPVNVPRRADFYGVQITGVNVFAVVTTADLDAAPTLVLSRQDYDLVDATASATSAVSATTIATTAGAGVVVTADANDRLWSFAVDSPAADYGTEVKCDYHAVLTINAAATSVVKIYGVEVTYKDLV